MKTKQFRKWLQEQGATFKDGSKHEKVYCRGKQSVLPRHTEIQPGTIAAICSQLGLGKPPSK